MNKQKKLEIAKLQDILKPICHFGVPDEEELGAILKGVQEQANAERKENFRKFVNNKCKKKGKLI